MAGKIEEISRRYERVAEVWVANPFKTYTEIAEIAGVSERTFFRYKDDPAFLAVYDRKCRETFRLMQSKAIQNLQKMIDSGNWNATKYALDGNEYTGTQKVAVQNTTINVSVDDDADESEE